MVYCPSQDWDRLCDEEDRAAEAEILFYRKNKHLIVNTAATIYANRQYDPIPNHIDKVIEIAAMIVQEVEARGSPDY